MSYLPSQRSRRKLATGLAFLGPNIIGFMTFTLLPLIFALVLAFTNWDLRLHNQFQDEALRFVGLENFTRLLSEPNFWRYLGNTLFLMMGIPFGIAGSLLAAVLLSQDLRAGSRRNWVWLIVGAVLISSTGILVMLGAQVPAMVMLIGGAASLILLSGTVGGKTLYRTLFYVPHFTAGVATFILWKKLYSPYTGPINFALSPLLDGLTGAVNTLPSAGVQSVAWLLVAGMFALLLFGVLRLGHWWAEGDISQFGVILGGVMILFPAVMGFRWMPLPVLGYLSLGAAGIAVVLLGFKLFNAARVFKPSSLGEGLGGTLMFATVMMVAQFILLGLTTVIYNLPVMASAPGGLEPPSWLNNVYWAKPSLMIMAFWAAIGSNNMLLYLAGLAGVPPELYEAAEIDGAGRFAKFWNVTWPQLAPVTFFIVVMSVIYGLQGGFEMARTMTNGGPAGATTTLSYYVYMEGFETGRLGYASAITWTLFGLVFLVTLFNWKFGNRYVND